jgi:hypothetical protein
MLKQALGEVGAPRSWLRLNRWHPHGERTTVTEMRRLPRLQPAHAAVALVASCGPASCAPPSEPDTPDTQVVVIEPSDGADTSEIDLEPEPAPAPKQAPEPDDEVVPCAAVTQAVLRSAMQSRRASEIDAGMGPKSFRCAKLQEGETLTQAFTLQPGRCYSVMAHSLPAIAEIDIVLMPHMQGTLPGMTAPHRIVLAQTRATGPSATLGSGANCYRNPLPMPMPVRAVVTARAGAGPVALRVYEK